VDTPAVIRRAIAGLAALALVMGVALFVPAGTMRWAEAWVYLGVFLGSSLLVTIDLARRDPALLERRTHAGPIAEPSPRQKVIQAVASVAFLGQLVLPGLDHRFGWTHVPAPVAFASEVLVALGFFVVARVFRANTYTSAVIEVGASQRVVSTGPYAVVRHPMYAGALLLMGATPIALGSLVGLAAWVLLTTTIVVRLLDEERVLARELEGYEEYCRTTRWRLLPHVF
jgi:protein-S-isoprenylcysteine O-methyltransferase Ste14